jgi:hypothetical protein
MIDLKDWIFGENLRPWLEILSAVVGYDFDDTDWDAVDAGIATTDSESLRWHEVSLGGDGAPLVKLAKEPGSAVVAVMASLPTDLVERAKLAIQIAQSYRLVSRS